uniref:Latent transforming growth factor beta binding protein 4 n=1 Tax=Aquila chrysaetos chrysaetos TaxID=223781 RepID=A0A663F154_AQUCH
MHPPIPWGTHLSKLPSLCAPTSPNSHLFVCPPLQTPISLCAHLSKLPSLCAPTSPNSHLFTHPPISPCTRCSVNPPHPSEHPSLHACTHPSLLSTSRCTHPSSHPPTHPVLSPDVDECRRSPRPCPNGRCENSVGSYRCLCSPGYRPSAAGTDCQGQWGPWVPPTRTPGSLGGLNPARVPADVDECAQSPPPCTHGRCENLPGGYRCTCPAGYRGTAPDEPCQDIDECENHLACPGQECINTPGSFQCQPCREGFQLHRGRCADVDECAVGSPCGPHGRCANTEGSFRCECRRGYRGTSCADVDECQRGGVCEGGRCANTDGSFECHCPAGFRTDADKALCQDVDECQEYGASLCGAQRCDNIPGSYRCVTDCQPGYRNVEGSFLCLCPDSRDEFDPVTGRCGPPPSPQTPPQPPGTAACFSKACGVLAPNVTQQQCCCSLGWAWGTQCPAQPCPTPGTGRTAPRTPSSTPQSSPTPLGSSPLSWG